MRLEGELLQTTALPDLTMVFLELDTAEVLPLLDCNLPSEGLGVGGGLVVPFFERIRISVKLDVEFDEGKLLGNPVQTGLQFVVELIGEELPEVLVKGVLQVIDLQVLPLSLLQFTSVQKLELSAGGEE